MRINAKTFKQWMRANFDDPELRDIARHGADAGWHGLTYYTDTVKLYERFKEELWEQLCQDAEDQGENVFAMMATFGGASHVSDYTTFANLLTWYAAETYARALTEDN